MKKTFLWMAAAIMTCGLAFTACTVEDNPNPYPMGEPEPEPVIKELVNLNFETGEVADYWALAIEESKLVTPEAEGSTGRAATIVASKDRGDYVKVDAALDGAQSYTVDMDLLINKTAKTTQFAVVGQNAWDGWTKWASNWGIYWPEAVAATGQKHTAILFSFEYTNSDTADMMVDIDSEGNVVNSGAQFIFENNVWYHLNLNVDVNARTVKYIVTTKADGIKQVNGTYNVPEGDSMIIKGIYERNGRYNYEPGAIAIDNVKVVGTF